MDQRVEGGAPIWGAGAHKVDQAVVEDIRARSHQPELDLGALAELRLALGKTNFKFEWLTFFAILCSNLFWCSK